MSDNFDEVLKRLEALNAASEARHQAMIAEIRGEVKEIRATVEGCGDTLAAAVQGIIEKRNYFSGFLGMVIAGAAVIIAAVQAYAVFFK